MESINCFLCGEPIQTNEWTVQANDQPEGIEHLECLELKLEALRDA
jgi:hypothetical protein